MTRVYWDTMLFAYWLESHPEFQVRVDSIHACMRKRGERVCGSFWSLCELLVYPHACGDQAGIARLQTYFQSAAVEILPLSALVAPKFAGIRADFRVGASDALHLAIAATAGVNLFLTNDHRLHRLKIPGIDFIAGLDTNLY